jgi:hypothetical protein
MTKENESQSSPEEKVAISAEVNAQTGTSRFAMIFRGRKAFVAARWVIIAVGIFVVLPVLVAMALRPTLSPTPAKPLDSTQKATPVPMLPHDRDFLCHSCQREPSIQVTVRSVVLEKKAGKLQLDYRLKNDSGEKLYISNTDDGHNNQVSFFTLAAPDGRQPKSNKDFRESMLPGQQKDDFTVFRSSLAPGHYEIRLQLMVGKDLTEYDPIPFEVP